MVIYFGNAVPTLTGETPMPRGMGVLLRPDHHGFNGVAYTEAKPEV
jgi:hypothetical protein